MLHTGVTLSGLLFCMRPALYSCRRTEVHSTALSRRIACWMHSDTPHVSTPLTWQRAYGLAALSGVLLILPFRIEATFPVTWVALLPLLVAIRGQRLRRAALLGLVAGTVAHLLGVYWLIGTMVRFGGIPTGISFILYLLIATAFGTIYIPFTLSCRLLPDKCLDSTLPGALFIAAAYSTSEYIFPGLFPWRIGYSQIHILPLAQIADVTGADGLTFLAALSSAVCYQLLIAYQRRPQPWPWLSVLSLAILLTAAFNYGAPRLAAVRERLSESEMLRVALLQPNVPFDEKFDPALADRNIAQLFNMSASVAADRAKLIIWPETGYRHPIVSSTEHLDLPVSLPANSYLYVGANVFELRDGGYNAYNSLLAVAADGAILGRYDKHRLFPFGEYMPYSDVFPELKKISEAISDFKAGSGPPIQQFPDGTVVGPLICYEDIFPGLSRQAVLSGARLLVNVTNDAWFGDTAAPHQHLQLALFRSIENRIPMVRATNTGVTAIISPTGEISRRAETYSETAIVDDVPLLQMQTFYNRHGDVFAMVSLLGVLVTLIWQLLQRKIKARDVK